MQLRDDENVSEEIREYETWDMEVGSELNDIAMNARFLFLGNHYLNVPGGSKVNYCYNLIAAVKRIGKEYGKGKGSDLKKGIVFIKNSAQCTSKRQVKMALRNVHNVLIREEENTRYIYRCSTDYYAKILKTIIECDSNNKHKGISNADYYIPDIPVGLRVVIRRACKQSEQEVATKMLEKINEL